MSKIGVLLDELVKRGGSDLHLTGGCTPLARVRGELVPLRDTPVDGKDLEEMLFEMLTASERARFKANHEIVFAYAHEDAARFRVSCFEKADGLGASLRHVPTRVPTLAELGCPEVFWKIADGRAGLVIVTGPSASGTSTTVAAMLDHVNKTRACHILTIEDPIEHVHEPLRAQITQREVGAHAVSFSAALRNAARECPDVVFVSEPRTPEAIKLALDLASSGVLVLFTMRSRGVVATLDRIVGSFASDEQPQVRACLADTLSAIVSQDLVRSSDNETLAVHEILVGSTSSAQLIREGKASELVSVMQAGQAAGMQTMDAALERLLRQSRITAEAAFDRSMDREAFGRVIARVRPDLAESMG